MQVGDLITHNPTGAMGVIVEDIGHSVRVIWSKDPMNWNGEEYISKLFIENLKSDKKCPRQNK